MLFFVLSPLSWPSYYRGLSSVPLLLIFYFAYAHIFYTSGFLSFASPYIFTSLRVSQFQDFLILAMLTRSSLNVCAEVDLLVSLCFLSLPLPSRGGQLSLLIGPLLEMEA